jgi:fibronectin type 3 domain-containing protein
MGSSFSSTCVVLWNGAQHPTQIVSSTQASAAIAQADVAVAGTAAISVLDTSTGLKSNTVTFVITTPQPPVQHQTTLSWNASSSPVIGYHVYRGTQAGGPYSLLSAGIVTADTFVDTSVASGRTYFYVVTAVGNTGVESAFSNEVAGVIPTP